MQYIIIGGSAAGAAAAREIRQRDANGSILMFTTDASFYSRCQLHLVASGHRTAAQANFLPHDWAQRFRVQVHHGATVVRLDVVRQRVTTAAGTEYPYDRLLLATGARSAYPPVPGLQGPQTFGFRDLPDAQALAAALPGAAHITVVGAGLVGCELAMELAALGKDVSLVEVAPIPLPLQLEEETGAMAAAALRAAGIQLYCGDRAAAVERKAEGRPVCLQLQSGRSLPADVIVAAAGVKANAELAAQAGIVTGRGITIDRYCRTSAANVFAAGDVTETEDAIVHQVMPSAIWPAAVRQGQVAGVVMAGGNDDSLVRNTGLRAAVVLGGTSVVSLGAVSMAATRGWNKLIHRYTNSRGRRCLKVFFLDGKRLMGAILWGDVTNAGVYGEAIITGRDITADLAALPDLDGARHGLEALTIH